MAVFDVTPNIGGNKLVPGNGASITNEAVSIRAINSCDNATSISKNGIYTYIPFEGKTFPLIEVTVRAENLFGISVTATQGETVVSGTTNADGIATLEVSAFGPWAVQATYGDITNVETIYVTHADMYSVGLSLFPATIFGVVWDMSNSSPEMKRLTSENDPNGYVNNTVSSEPSPAVGTGGGSSPFDNYLPWMGMKEVNIVDRDIIDQDNPLFTRTANDTMVYIPPFYYKIISSEDMIYFYIADNKISGFELHPGSNTYVARYRVKIENGVFTSKSGGTPSYGSSFNADYARSYATKKGSGWQIFDYSTWCAIFLLYAVEFADWNSQLKIGFGTTGTQDVNTGNTDPMTYHTGYAGANGKSFIQYRNIEAIYGTTWQWLDGINIRDNQIYICNNPANFSDSITQYYSDTNTAFGAGSYIKSLAYSNEYSWVFVPASSGGSSSTYIPDDTYGGEGLRVLMVGSSYSYGLGSGMYIWAQNYKADSSMSYAGWRLEFRRSLEGQR